MTGFDIVCRLGLLLDAPHRNSSRADTLMTVDALVNQ
jgi:hypothetical protein